MKNLNYDVLVKLNRFNRVESKNVLKFYEEKGWKNSGKKMRESYYKSGGYINYITRENAVVKADLSFQELKNLDWLRKEDSKQYELELKKINDSNIFMSGIWDKDGHLDMDRKKELNTKLADLNDDQIIWDSIISLDRKFAAEHEFMTVSQFHKVIKKNIGSFFKQAGFNNPKKLNWFFTMHSNTDNPHIHLGFYEEEPQFINQKNGKLSYRKKGALPLDSFTFFGNRIRESIISEKMKSINILEDRTRLINIFDKVLNEGVDYNFDRNKNSLSESFKKEKKDLFNWSEAKQVYTDLNVQLYGIAEKLTDLSKSFVKKNKFAKLTYGFLDEETKILVDNLSIELIKTVPSIQEAFNSWKEDVQMYQDKLTKIKEDSSDENAANSEQGLEISIHDILKDKVVTPRDRNIVESLNFYNDQLNDVKNGLMSRLGNIVIKKASNLVKKKNSSERSLSTKIRHNFNENEFYQKHSVSAWDKLLNELNDLFWEKKNESMRKYKRLRNERIRLNKEEIWKIKREREREND